MGEDQTTDKIRRADELEGRLVDFSVAIIKLSEKLPRTAAGKHVADQILRSGTSPAPNYGELRGAESDADFSHKLGVIRKELNETRIWLRIIEKSAMADKNAIAELFEENDELCRIINSSYRTSRQKSGK